MRGIWTVKKPDEKHFTDSKHLVGRRNILVNYAIVSINRLFFVSLF